MEREFTLSVFSENHVGLLGRVTAIFTRRTLNIESLTVSESEVPGIHRFTIVVRTTPELARKVAAQLERQVDVLKAFVHERGEFVERDLALYKVDALRADASLDALLTARGARLLERQREYVVVEQTGTEADTAALLAELRPYGVLEFVRSGRVALTRPMRSLEGVLAELDRSAGPTAAR